MQEQAEGQLLRDLSGRGVVAKVCDEVNKLLATERPEIERQLGLIDTQMAQARQRRVGLRSSRQSD